MEKLLKRSACAVLALIFIVNGPTVSRAASPTEIQAAVSNAAAYIQKAVPSPEVGSVGGEWAVLGLARSGLAVPDSYFRSYYAAVESTVASCKGDLSDKKYTEYSRVVLALTAIGKGPSDVGGYDLLTPLGDYDKTVWQGINGPIFALIALDGGGYKIPKNSAAKTQATRGMYLDKILSSQLADGGFAMCLQATANTRLYQPSISIRVHSETPRALYEKAAEVTRLGLGMRSPD